MSGHAGALAMVAGRLGRHLMPPESMPLSEYLQKHLVLIDGPFAGQLWTALGAPYLREIADCLGEEHPCNRVVVRKSQQTGVSILALGWMLYIADREPANTLYGGPGGDFLRDLAGQKFGPLIAAWQKRMRRVVIEPQTSRSGAGSTTFEKRFPGGYVAFVNANSATDLASKTAKKGVKDEFSKWQYIPGVGDPSTLFEGRFTAFRRTKDFKIFELSTPEVDSGDEDGAIEGHCRIDRSFRASDRRFWHIRCPECRNLLTMEIAGLAIDYDHPHRTRYRCRCGHMISEAERVGAIRCAEEEGAGWIPSIDDPGRQPGFHVDAFISLMMSFEAIVEDKIANDKNGEKGKKDFANTVLGLPYRYKGDAPDWKRLMERREDNLLRYRVPARGLLLVASADVQMRGIWYEVIAISPNRETWVVDRDYIDGDTSSPHNPVFADLRALTLDKAFPDAFGRMRTIDALGIDSGYRAHVVYAWVRANQRLHPMTGRDMVLAIKGMDGWNPPPIGTPTPVDIDLDGKKIRQGCKLWPVGTWSLKAGFYSDLHKVGIRSGEMVDPDGYCHFGRWLDEAYFKQITSEHLTDIIVRKRVTGRRWEKTTDNHLLDCRIYNLALAEYLGLSSMTPEDWAELARRRGLPDELTALDLFAPRQRITTAPEVAAEAEAGGPAVSPAPPPPQGNYYDRLAALNDD
jgi:phage terminase large subunit GpA-like protein